MEIGNFLFSKCPFLHCISNHVYFFTAKCFRWLQNHGLIWDKTIGLTCFTVLVFFIGWASYNIDHPFTDCESSIRVDYDAYYSSWILDLQGSLIVSSNSKKVYFLWISIWIMSQNCFDVIHNNLISDLFYLIRQEWLAIKLFFKVCSLKELI